jgi:nitronate monooxygenase
MNSFTNALGIKYPIIQAPMAGGGVTTPELVAEVSKAGALGSIGAGMMNPQAILEMSAAVRALNDEPFNINLFVLRDAEAEPRQIARALELLEPFRRELGLAPGAVPVKFSENFSDQLAAVREVRPRVVSFTFGIVDRKTVAELHKDGSLVIDLTP